MTDPRSRFTTSTRGCDLGCGRPGTDLLADPDGSVLLACAACARSKTSVPAVPRQPTDDSPRRRVAWGPLLIGLVSTLGGGAIGTGITPPTGISDPILGSLVAAVGVWSVAYGLTHDGTGQRSTPTR